MNSSPESYHEIPLSEQSPHLETDATMADDLIAVLEDFPHPQGSEAIRIIRGFSIRASAEVKRRHDRLERLETDPVMIDELKDDALALIAALPISQYLAWLRPGILLWCDGNEYHGPCPYASHDFDEDSFRIFGDDYAWCRSCGGGNLFRVIGLVEALPSPYQQVRRAAEIAGIELPDRSRKIIPPDHSYRGSGTKERFSEVRIVAGRVVS